MTENGKLSEADALLNRASELAFGSGPPAEEPQLSPEEIDTLGEIGNISFGAAATALSTLLQQRVEITTPKVCLLAPDDVRTALSRPYVMVAVEYTDGLMGSNILVVELDDAKIIADLMLGGTGKNVSGELNELHLSAVAEAMNQMMGGAATAMSSIFSRKVNISPPNTRVVDLSADDIDIGLEGWLVHIAFQMRVGTLIDSQIMQLIPLSFAREMAAVAGGLAHRGQSSADVGTAAVVKAREATEPGGVFLPPPGLDTDLQGSSYVQDRLGLQSSQGEQISPGSEGGELPNKVAVSRTGFADFGSEARPTQVAPRNLSLLYDVLLNVTVELGRTRRPIKEILELNSGSLLELDNLAGEPVDILVNNKRIAVGEIVVIDENFGVRITDIVSPLDRMKNLE
ncbi:MAG: flagellar motor switch phosphatase FliY [Alicyclobacillaceae bacterium]|nr:flagellar motor switch phosphatase FliY [Alicyclobacillaceae bacterium]